MIAVDPATPNGRLRIRRAGLADLRKKHDGIDSRRPIAIVRRAIHFQEECSKRAIVVDPGERPHGAVTFGAEVEVARDDIRHSYRRVGEDEAEPARELVTSFSPFSVALPNVIIGDTVEWPGSTGAVDLDVTVIQFRSGVLVRRSTVHFRARINRAGGVPSRVNSHQGSNELADSHAKMRGSDGVPLESTRALTHVTYRCWKTEMIK